MGEKAPVKPYSLVVVSYIERWNINSPHSAYISFYLFIYLNRVIISL